MILQTQPSYYITMLCTFTISRWLQFVISTSLISLHSSAKVALWNHAMYNSVKNGCPVHLDFSEGRREVETAIRGIDASLEQIAENGMISFVPIAM